MEKYIVIWKSTVEADSPRQAAELAKCEQLGGENNLFYIKKDEECSCTEHEVIDLDSWKK